MENPQIREFLPVSAYFLPGRFAIKFEDRVNPMAGCMISI